MQTRLVLNSQRSACHCLSSDEIKDICYHAYYEHYNFTLELFSCPFPSLSQSQGPSHAHTRGLGGCFLKSMLGSELSAYQYTMHDSHLVFSTHCSILYKVVIPLSVHTVVYQTRQSFGCQYTLQYTIHGSRWVISTHCNCHCNRL